MKKLMMLAIMFVAAATAFAGDSDALKAILKAKTYADAEQLLKSNLAQLANDEEKATAYNKLVDLAMDVFNSQSTIQTENQLAKQMGKEEKPVDEKLMSEMAYNAIIAGIECDKYDKLPNAKGKVKPAYDKKNAQRLWVAPRNQLVNAGQDALTKQDYATARKYWTAFIDSDSAPLFKDCDRNQQAPFFGQVARVTAVLAYQDKDMEKALQLADIAMKDSAEYEGALNLKLEIYGKELQSREDSINYINKMKDLYAKHKVDGVIERVYNTYMGLNMLEEASSYLDGILAQDPNCFVALADKGVWLLQAQKPDEAITYLVKAMGINPENALVATYTGTAYSMIAQNTDLDTKKKELYGEAIKYFDIAKQLDPDRIQSNWGYNRYSAYFNYYGEDAPETKQAEEDYKY